MTKSLQEALTRIEKAEDKFASLDPELQMNQAIGAKKDAKRQKELQRLQEDLEASREQDAEKYDT